MNQFLEALCIISYVFALLRLSIALYNLLSRPLLEKTCLQEPASISKQPESPLLSILVPARNEEETLPFLIASLQNLSFKNFELILLNDNSADNTLTIMAEQRQLYGNIRLLEGKELPSGWLGKNWACHQLAQNAAGKYLLFLDADVEVKGLAIEKALSVITRNKLSLLSVFPEQIIVSNGEKRTVPLMHYLLLSMLPLDFIYWFKAPSLAAANGQFMLFESEVYKRHCFHKMCKSEITEDIKIMQTIKHLGLKGKTLLGNNLVFCRMYRSYQEGINGFSKNLLAGFGNSRTGLLFYLFLIIVVPLYILFTLPLYGVLYLFIVLCMRVVIAFTCEQSATAIIGFHISQMFSLVIISYSSINNSYSKTLEWKGRRIR